MISSGVAYIDVLVRYNIEWISSRKTTGVDRNTLVILKLHPKGPAGVFGKY